MYKLCPCIHKGECTKLLGKNSCEFLHAHDDAKLYLDQYHERQYKFFTHYYDNVLQEPIHNKFRQVVCTNWNHHHNEFKKSSKWNLYKDCPFAHSEEEAEFYRMKAQ